METLYHANCAWLHSSNLPPYAQREKNHLNIAIIWYDGNQTRVAWTASQCVVHYTGRKPYLSKVLSTLSLSLFVTQYTANDFLILIKIFKITSAMISTIRGKASSAAWTFKNESLEDWIIGLWLIQSVRTLDPIHWTNFQRKLMLPWSCSIHIGCWKSRDYF